MLFQSPVFLFLFLPLVLIVNFFLEKKYRNYFLLAVSLFFYAWGEGFFTIIMLGSILINYIAGLVLANNKFDKKKVVFFSVIINLLAIGFFKYFNFFLANFNILLGQINIQPIMLGSVHLPVGISFFTFQAMSYVIDAYRGKVKPQKNLFNLGLFISLFPQLIAGPIVRYSDVEEQIKNREENSHLVLEGIKRFIMGLAKKVIIADSLAVVVNNVFSYDPATILPATAWLGILCYTLQIYFDFSGYSDMAIGLGKMLGFKFLENFNYPYISKSIREFWTRWHISLSTWFRDYVYIPLGGNRVSKIRNYINLWVVFLLCGLWHGASWTFVVWGAYNGFFLVIERLFLGKYLKKIPPFLSWLYMIFVVMCGFVFFRSKNIIYALSYFKTMAGFNKSAGYCGDPWLQLNNFIIFMIIIAIIGSGPVLKKIMGGNEKLCIIKKPIVSAFILIFYVLIFLSSILTIASGQLNSFIYFKF